MKYGSACVFVLTTFVYGCGDPFPGPREIDWKKEWTKNESRLKALTNDILSEGNAKYHIGNNDFPDHFDYPFDEGYSIRNSYYAGYTDHIVTKNITITYYVDRGLLDHYSAFIFTKDSATIEELDRNVKNGGNDFKIEPNWYMVND